MASTLRIRCVADGAPVPAGCSSIPDHPSPRPGPHRRVMAPGIPPVRRRSAGAVGLHLLDLRRDLAGARTVRSDGEALEQRAELVALAGLEGGQQLVLGLAQVALEPAQPTPPHLGEQDLAGAP